jgi:hypothetical protein
VGVLSDPPDGGFGNHTDAALKRFQWYLGNIPMRLTAGGQAVEYVSVTPSVANGVLDSVTAQALVTFVNGGFTCGGPLVRVDFNSLPRFHASSGFDQLLAGSVAMVVDRGFAQILFAMNMKAQQENLYVRVNQVFRLEGVAVNNPVVPPAGHSAHKLGRAIDLQLGTSAGSAQPSATMMTAGPDSPMGRFRDHIKSLGCRYGGSFVPHDPPHYDQQVFPVTSEEWKNRFFFAQRQYSSGAGSPVTRIPAQ